MRYKPQPNTKANKSYVLKYYVLYLISYILYLLILYLVI